MIKIIVSDLSRVLLFPTDYTYKQSLNALSRSLATKNAKYNFWDYFKINEELIDIYQSISIPVHIFTSDSIQEQPALKEKLDYFSSVMSAKKLGLSKEDPKAYITLSEILNVSPSEILYIDDSLKNNKAAHIAGMKTIHYESNEETLKIIHGLTA